MADYIDREETVKTVRLFNALTDDEKEWEIRRIPSADVAPVRHGRWEVIDAEEPRRYGCSECGCVFEEEEPTYNYCPYCGARMDGDENE